VDTENSSEARVKAFAVSRLPFYDGLLPFYDSAVFNPKLTV
jgi:hypothetical protein